MALAHPVAQMHKARAPRCRTRRATIEREREDIAHDEGENRRWETTGEKRASKVARGRCDAAKREREREGMQQKGGERGGGSDWRESVQPVRMHLERAEKLCMRQFEA